MTEEDSQVARYPELCKQALNALYEEGLGYSAAYDKKYEELMQNPIANAQALIQLYENYKKQLDKLDKKREASINTYSNKVVGCAQRLKSARCICPKSSCLSIGCSSSYSILNIQNCP